MAALLTAAWGHSAVAHAQGAGEANLEGVQARPESGLAPAPEIFGRADYSWRIRPLEGEETTLESFRGEVLFINLWASWCTPCVRELGSIERLQNRVADSDIRFLVVAADLLPFALLDTKQWIGLVTDDLEIDKSPRAGHDQ